VAALVLLALARAAAVVLRRRAARERLYGVERAAPSSGDAGTLRRFLFLAGYRSRRATGTFVAVQAAALLGGVGLAWALTRTGTLRAARAAAEGVPGGIGGALGPVFDLAGVLVAVLVASLPLLWVRRARRRRREAIERDLPVALELLSSLARSGLGFDAAVARVLAAEREPRPLAEELAGYRADVLAGLPREESFQRLADRAAVPSVDVFVAAMTHSERLGVGLSDTLRRQADELWGQRRERALARAQTLPARLAAPLIVCFLPGLMVVTLGPALVQFWETVTGLTGGAE
jgi:tight adherence protein C